MLLIDDELEAIEYINNNSDVIEYAYHLPHGMGVTGLYDNGEVASSYDDGEVLTLFLKMPPLPADAHVAAYSSFYETTDVALTKPVANFVRESGIFERLRIPLKQIRVIRDDTGEDATPQDAAFEQ
jgi:hypothetical protein